MNVKFATWGNSIALRVPRALIDQLGVADGSAAQIRIEDGSLVVTPASPDPRFALDTLLSKITDENIHGEVGTNAAVGDEFA